MDASEITLLDAVDDDRLPQLMALFASAWWTAERSRVDVRQMLAASDLVIAILRRSDDRLLGFARILTDFTYLAVILDVIVAHDARGQGVGAMLMNSVVAHPQLTNVDSLELVCQPEVQAFYRQWGFTEQVGQSRLMRRTSDPLVTDPLLHGPATPE